MTAPRAGQLQGTRGASSHRHTPQRQSRCGGRAGNCSVQGGLRRKGRWNYPASATPDGRPPVRNRRPNTASGHGEETEVSR